MKAQLVLGPLDGGEVDVPDPPPQVILVSYLADAYPGVLWTETPTDPLHVPCPVNLLYIRDGDQSGGPRYRYR